MDEAEVSRSCQIDTLRDGDGDGAGSGQWRREVQKS